MKDKGPLFNSLLLFPLLCVLTDSLQGKIPLFFVSHWLAYEGKKTRFIGECMELRSSSLPAFLCRLIRLHRIRPAPKVSSSAKPSLNFAFLLFTLLVKGRKWWSDDKYGACLEKWKPFSCEHKPPCFPGWWKTLCSWLNMQEVIGFSFGVRKHRSACPARVHKQWGRFIQISKSLCNNREIL